MISNKPSTGYLPKLKFKDNSVGAENYVADFIRNKIYKKHIRGDKIAVLCRNNLPLVKIKNAIESQNLKNSSELI